MWRGGWSALQDACVQLNSIKKEISSILPAGCRLPALRGGMEEIKERGNVHYRLWPFFPPFAVSPLQETHFALSPPLALSLSLSLWGKV